MMLKEKYLRELIASILLESQISLDEADPAKIAASIRARNPVLPPERPRGSPEFWGERPSITADPSQEELENIEKTKLQWAAYDQRDLDQIRTEVEKELKRIWADEVKEAGARKFFQKEVIKIHWIGGYSSYGGSGWFSLRSIVGFLQERLGHRNGDEFACLGAHESEQILPIVQGKEYSRMIGVVIDGFVTYATGEDAMTQWFSTATEKVKEKHKSSGLYKRPLFTNVEDIANQMMIDKESFERRKKNFHEIIVDNWIITKIVIPEAFWKNYSLTKVPAFKEAIKEGSLVEYEKENCDRFFDLCEEYNLEIINEKNEITDLKNPFNVPSFWDICEDGKIYAEMRGDDGIPKNSIVYGNFAVGPTAPAFINTWIFFGGNFTNITQPLLFENCELKTTTFDSKLISNDSPTHYFSKCIIDRIEFSSESNVNFVMTDCKINDLKIEYFYSEINMKKVLFINCKFENCDKFFKLIKIRKEKFGMPAIFKNCVGVPDDLLQSAPV